MHFDKKLFLIIFKYILKIKHLKIIKITQNLFMNLTIT